MTQPRVALAALLGSIAVHSTLIVGHSSPPRVPPVARAFVELSVVAPPPPPAPSPVPPAPPAPPPPQVVRRASQPTTKAAEVAREPAVAPPPPLSGTTLVASEGDGWSAPEGDGSSRTAPALGTAAAKLDARATVPVARALPSAPPLPAVVPLTELAKKPVPPALEASLARNYPVDSRSQGKSGEARVRARIEAGGQVSLATISSESAPGFGAACQKTLLSSRWTPPIDALGRPVATFVTYRCRFRVDR